MKNLHTWSNFESIPWRISKENLNKISGTPLKNKLTYNEFYEGTLGVFGGISLKFPGGFSWEVPKDFQITKIIYFGNLKNF